MPGMQIAALSKACQAPLCRWTQRIAIQKKLWGSPWTSTQTFPRKAAVIASSKTEMQRGGFTYSNAFMRNWLKKISGVDFFFFSVYSSQAFHTLDFIFQVALQNPVWIIKIWLFVCFFCSAANTAVSSPALVTATERSESSSLSVSCLLEEEVSWFQEMQGFLYCSGAYFPPLCIFSQGLSGCCPKTSSITESPGPPKAINPHHW